MGDTVIVAGQAALGDAATVYPIQSVTMPFFQHLRSHAVLTAAFLLSICGPGQAAVRTFHIDPAGGRDDADGMTPATAWKGAAGLRQRPLRPGDKVLFKAGTRHTGEVALTGGGARGQRVEIGRYDDGPAPVLDGAGAAAALVLTNPDFMEVRDLELTNTRTDKQARNGLVVQANDGTAAEQLWFHHLHIHHVAGHDDRNGGAGMLLGAGRSATRQASRYIDLVIEHCWLHDVPFNGILVSGWDTRGRTAGGRLENASTGVVVRGNLLHEVAGDGICLINTEGAIIEHNEVYRACYGQVRGQPEACSAGIWPHSSDRAVMRWNRVEGLRGKRDGQAFDVDVDCRDTLVEYNLSRNNGTGFLLVCATKESERDLATLRTVVRNNLSVDDAAEAPGALVTLVSRITDIAFENNAFVLTSPGERRLMFCGNWLSPDWPAGVRWERNLLVTAGTLFNEPMQTKRLTFSGNFWSGTFRGFAADPKPVTGIAHFREPPGISFDTAVNPGSPVLVTGFRPFSLAKVGLLPASPWRSQAETARKGQSTGPQ